MAALDAAPVIIVAEGYATAATIAEAVGHATVAGFDSGNLPAVARALRERYPDKPMLIAGDDDLAVKLKDGVNPGAEKAAEAAQAVGGKAITPIFGAGEQQGEPKRFSDFNDLATKSTLGAEAVARQVGAAVKTLQVERDDDRKQVRDRQQEQQPKQRRAARMS